MDHPALKELYSILDKITGTKENSTIYKGVFKKMSKKAFITFWTEVKSGVRKLPVFIPPQNKTSMDVDVIMKEADRLGFIMEDTLEIEEDGVVFSGHNTISLSIVPVTRLSQTLESSISTPEADTRTDAITGQPVADSKSASISPVELSVLSDDGMELAALELASVRAGDIGAFSFMKASTNALGTVSLDRAKAASTGVGSTHFIKTFLLGKHIGSNL